MKALVTGSAGFIGDEITRTLIQAGYETTGLDIADGHDCRGYFRSARKRFDVVVHCAAVVGGRRVIDWTPLRHAHNLELDAGLFQWAERTKPGRVVYFSSSCAYPEDLGRGEWRMREEDITWPPGPMSWPDGFYGWAKLTGELIAHQARRAGVAVSVVRPFSVYGPRVRDGFAVRGFLEQVRRRAKPLVIWGDAEQVRDYIHVCDVAAAVVEILRQGVDGPVNLGTGEGTTLRVLATTMAQLAGYQPAIKVDETMPAGAPSLVADVTQLHAFYRPKVTLGAGLAEILGQ